MNDEIKEILSCLNSSSWYYEANKLLEHIINLQHEINKYKSRCEKAIEYMQENYNELTDYGYKKEIYDDLLNILQNGSDSQ